MSWLSFWTIFLLASLAGFAVLVVVITVMGFREIRMLVAGRKSSSDIS